MWDKFKQITVNRDHAIVIHVASNPGKWFGAGTAYLAPLYRKRKILLARANWVYAWTLYNDALGTENWLVPKNTNSSLHVALEIKTRSPSGWYFTIPVELRAKGWLPEAGGLVVCEYSESELNLWTHPAYNEEAILEAEST